VLDPPPPGLASLLQEEWDRYRIPMMLAALHWTTAQADREGRDGPRY